ncbi:MAG: VOC family protein [Amaricoccus sp.]|uniref:VOC family protein n=1 Tax=Amaricoccus sp. TaxID=1872485 RepID=UPI0039E5A193
MPYKPEGHTSVAPYLIVPDAEATLAFVRAVFAAEPIFLKRADDGTIQHAEVRIDDTVVMCGQYPGVPPAHVHVYLPDVDAAFARAIDAGGTVEQPVAEKGDGDRRGGVADPNGTVWWLATEIEPR